MLTAYVPADKKLVSTFVEDELPSGFVWIDMLNPTPAEEKVVEAALGIDIPTHEDMKEIETSSRLYKEDGALFMTGILLCGSQREKPQAEPVSFILTGGRLVTVRYSEPHSFVIFAERAEKSFVEIQDGPHVFTAILDVIIDRLADALERVAADVDEVSVSIFQRSEKGKPYDFTKVLQHIGKQGDLNSKVRESLVSLARMVTYFEPALEDIVAQDRDCKTEIAILHQDVKALLDHASFLSTKINFLLEASLGMINIEQNTIIKFFSVAAVVFMPPTLIASIYGMNFQHMPELSWHFGYPLAVCAMVVSAIGPYAYFKKRGWF